jgi:hypothetical protein
MAGAWGETASWGSGLFGLRPDRLSGPGNGDAGPRACPSGVPWDLLHLAVGRRGGRAS